jgi:hypothetical protein
MTYFKAAKKWAALGLIAVLLAGAFDFCLFAAHAETAEIVTPVTDIEYNGYIPGVYNEMLGILDFCPMTSTAVLDSLRRGGIPRGLADTTFKGVYAFDAIYYDSRAKLYYAFAEAVTEEGEQRYYYRIYNEDQSFRYTILVRGGRFLFYSPAYDEYITNAAFGLALMKYYQANGLLTNDMLAEVSANIDFLETANFPLTVPKEEVDTASFLFDLTIRELPSPEKDDSETGNV